MRGQRSLRLLGGLLLGLSMMTSACAMARGSANIPVAASNPAQQVGLDGIWHGLSYELGPASEYDGVMLTVRFDQDGRWTIVERQRGRTREFSGMSSIRGDHIELAEASGHYFLRLTRSGNRLYFYGPYPFADPGYSGHAAIELRRTP